jgi:hypothetical protein
MLSTKKMQLIKQDGSVACFNNVYIYDDDSITFQGGTFVPVGRHTAIIFDKTDVEIRTGEIVKYNNCKRVIIGVCDNRNRAKIKPHIKLTLQ